MGGLVIGINNDIRNEAGGPATLHKLSPAKAWLSLDQTDQSAGVNLDGVRDSFGVASVVGGGVGISTVNFTNVFVNDGYSVGGFASQLNNNPRIRLTASITASAYQYQNENTAGVAANCPYDFTQYFGDLA